MSAKSQQQMKFIFAMRGKYKTKRKAPKAMKWVFDEEWTSGVKMKKLPKKVKSKKESHIMNFTSFVNEHSQNGSIIEPNDDSNQTYDEQRFSPTRNNNIEYSFEDFTLADMEFVKELYIDGMTDPGQIAVESDLDVDTVNQIIQTLLKRDEINESEFNDEHLEHPGCGCDICNCVGTCTCDCCCGPEEIAGNIRPAVNMDEPWYEHE